MQNIQNILDTILQPSVQTQSWKINLIKNWPTIIGNLHEKVSLQKIHANSLVLGVRDSSWIQELYLLSKQIIKKINRSLDRPRIETLRFQCVESARLTAKTIHTSDHHKKIIVHRNFSLKPVQITALQKIKDPQLAQALEQFLQRCQQ